MKPTASEPLTEADYAALARAYISREIADAGGIYRVTSLDGRELIGRKNNGDYSGIVFPYRAPGSNYAVAHRLRLDNPPLGSDGKPEHKYLQAAGTRNRIFFPPCDPALLSNITVPVVTTEGEKKCLALWRMALETGNGTSLPAFLPTAFTGVWSWKGTIGTLTNAKGERVPEKGPLPDLDLIAWSGRKTTILYDANAATNPLVAAARRALACELAGRGAEVWIADLPAAIGVNGCDDYLYIFGTEKLGEVLRQAVRYDWRKDLILTDKGNIRAVLANAITALRSAPEWAGALTFDEFSLRTSTIKSTPWNLVGPWDEQADRLLADWLQHHGIMVSDLVAAAAAETVAHDRTFHPVKDYLDSLKWDKIGRIDDWLTLYLGADSREPDRKALLRAVGAKWLISAVARIYQPGSKADHMLIIEGPQGSFKSTAFRLLGAPWFTDDIADLGSKDSQLATLGAWIIELPELDAMSGPELSRVKAFLSRTTDRFRPPYGRRLIESPRQCVFVGTVNHSEYLRDETGGRRFWPVKCGRIDLETLRRDKDQLWAEAVHRYWRRDPWWLETSELNKTAAEEQDARYQSDSWESIIAEWLSTRSEVTVADILAGPLNKPRGTWSRWDEMRVGTILRRLQWGPGPGRKRPRIYMPTLPPQPN
jgi:predicted P-loop ATPase